MGSEVLRLASGFLLLAAVQQSVNSSQWQATNSTGSEPAASSQRPKALELKSFILNH